MKIDGNLPIAKLAADLPGAMAIFEALGLDYACAGDRSLDDAAHAEGIAPEVVLANLRRLKSAEHTASWNVSTRRTASVNWLNSDVTGPAAYGPSVCQALPWP